jgi:HAD superfamily hydrolase (TIGR01549 family)
LKVSNLPFDLVIFDLDGTLVEFRYPSAEARQSVVDLLGSLGISLPLDVIRKPIQDIFDEAAIQVKKSGLLNLDDVMARVNDVLDYYEMEAAISTAIFEDTKNVLEALKNAGLKTALVTNNGRKATEFMLERFGLKDFFDVIVTRNDGLRLKPYPDGILWVISRVGASRAKTLFVGDSPIDIKAGRAAGVTVAALKSRFFKSLDDFEIKPDYLLDRLSDILFLIRRL